MSPLRKPGWRSCRPPEKPANEPPPVDLEAEREARGKEREAERYLRRARRDEGRGKADPDRPGVWLGGRRGRQYVLGEPLDW